MKTKFLITVVMIAVVAGFVTYTSGAFTPLQSDLSECHYADDENSVPQPCMVIDGWYDMLLRQSLQTEQNRCGDKYMRVGNDECVLNPEFIKPNIVIIYDVTENSGTRLSVAPHTLVMNLSDKNSVTFVNNGSTTVNILDDSEEIWHFDSVEPSSQRSLIINNTGFYKFLIQNSREGESGEIVALSEDTDSLSVETRAKMAQAVISGNYYANPELVGVGSGGAPGTGVLIMINEKELEKYEDAKSHYYAKYRKMVPFDVPITIEFSAPIRTQ